MHSEVERVFVGGCERAHALSLNITKAMGLSAHHGMDQQLKQPLGSCVS